MTAIESEGKTVDDATRAACERLGIDEKDADVEVLQAPKSVLGVNMRKAVVRVTPKLASEPAPPGNGRGDHPSDARSDAGFRDEDSEDASEEGEPFDPVSALETICRYIAPDARVSEQRESDRLVLKVSGGDGSGVFIGRRGQTLDALQYIMNRMTAKRSPRVGRIIVDSENYRSRRIARIEDDAKKMAQRVKKSGKPMSSEPLNAFDRRIIHTTLRDDGEIETRSLGEGEFKCVQVFLRES